MFTLLPKHQASYVSLKVYLLLFAFFNFKSVHLFSQSSSTTAYLNVDSINRHLKSERTDSLTLYQYVDKLNYDISESDLNARLVICSWLKSNAKKKGLIKLVAVSDYILGNTYVANDEFVKAVEILTATRKYAKQKRLYEIEIQCLGVIANVYYYNKQYNKAEEIYKECLVECKRLNNKKGLFSCYNGLGVAQFARKGTSREEKIQAMETIKGGVVFLDPDKDPEDLASLATAYSNIAGMYNLLNEYDSSLSSLQKAFPLLQRTNLQAAYMPYYFNLGNAYMGKRDFEKALPNYLSGLEISKREKSGSWRYEYYKALSNFYQINSDASKALEYYKQFHLLYDSIVNVENFAKAADIQNKYEAERKAKEIIRLNRDNQIKELQIEQENAIQRRLYIIIGFVSLVIVLLAVLVIAQLRSIREKKASYNLLQEKNLDIERKSTKLSEQSKLIAKYQSQMNPHFVFNAINNIQGFVINQQLDKSIDQLQLFGRLMRSTFNNSEREWLTLEEERGYLQNYMHFEQQRFKTKVDFRVMFPDHAGDEKIPPMMIQPLVENAIKHAGLNTLNNPKIEVEIQLTEHGLNVSVIDNGLGFNAEDQLRMDHSHALAILRSRIILLFESRGLIPPNNVIRVVSNPNNGTSINFNLPFI